MSRAPGRVTAAVCTVVVLATMLTGCGGGGNPYCDAVEKAKTTLDSFGEKRTDAGYTTYATTLRTIGKQAPATVRKDWTGLAKATEDVLAAQRDVGLKLEQMTDATKVKSLSTAQLKKLNNAYEAFNKTTDQRQAVVKNVKKECKITIS